MTEYHVGLDSWIIQDGNYGDFAAGSTAKFALEFSPLTMHLIDTGKPRLERIGACRFHIRAEVAYLNRSVWVLDFGIMAFQNQKPRSKVRKGNWVEGEVYLGIDPFFYFEGLHARRGMPQLQYNWRIRKIFLETTPWLGSEDEEGRTILTRDRDRESFVEVAKTNAWEDDDKRAHYILQCEKIG